MIPLLESVIATEPFTLRREVRWSDCDPAGVVFTGRFSDYALSATERMASLPWPEAYLAPFAAYHGRHAVPETLKKMAP